VTELIRDQIASLIKEGIQIAQEKGALPAFQIPDIAVERPRQAEHGDYATPVCLQLASEAKMAPRTIASRIIQQLPSAPAIGEVSVAGPGYINVSLEPAWLATQVETILQQGTRWGHLDLGRGQRVQVEFVSSNPTGPITVGSTRNAVIGDTLAGVLNAAGFAVEREYYVNDAGSQVRKFGESLFARYAQARGREEPFPEDGYQGEYVVEMGRAIAQQVEDQYLQVPVQEAIRALGEIGMERILAEIREDLAALRVTFDTWFHERSVYQSGLFDRVMQKLQNRGYIVEREEAIWFTSPELEDDAVVIRSPRVIPNPHERPTYFASDIAYAWDKLVERGFDRAIYVWGADHHGDVPRVKAAASALGLNPDRVEIILYQMVNLKRGGEDIRMSTRAGQFVTLRELLEEVGPDPIRFLLLTRTVDATIDFDLDLAVEESDKNPVYYVQYAHARISSILRYATEQGWAVDKPGDVSLLAHESEQALIRKMLELPEVVAQAAEQRAPHRLTFYTKELASDFHAFYRDCRVVAEEAQAQTQARLMLVRAAQLTLAQALSLLGVTAPERM
jgi:arginyl-tRNA synthetase